jgi:hypothetical protein
MDSSLSLRGTLQGTFGKLLCPESPLLISGFVQVTMVGLPPLLLPQKLQICSSLLPEVLYELSIIAWPWAQIYILTRQDHHRLALDQR